jgi:hypothetical protein
MVGSKSEELPEKLWSSRRITENDTFLFFYDMLEAIKPQDGDLVRKIIES